MGTLSKFFGDTLGFRLMTAECWEFSHTWNPDCYDAIGDAVGGALLFCFKTYGLLYLVNSAIRSGGDPRKIKWGQLLKNTLRSSIFLTTNLVLLLFFICRLRQALGFAIWPTASFASSVASSFISIFIEAKKRRLMLAIYLSNLASESVFRQLLHRGKVRQVPGAQAILFAVGLAVIFQLLKINFENSEKSATIESLSNNLETAKNLTETPKKSSDDAFLRNFINMTHFNGKLAPVKRRENARKFLLAVLKFMPSSLRRSFVPDSTVRLLKSDPTFLSERSVEVVSSVQLSARNFTIAATVSVLLSTLKNLKKPKKFLSTLRHPSNLLRMPLFFGLMPLLYQLAHRLLSAVPSQRLQSISPAICGAVSGTAMLIWPNTNVSMYVLWKAIEMVYRRLASTLTLIPNWRHGDAILYGIASGYIVGIAIIEPHALRSNYYKFLTQLTGDRIQLFNRELFSQYFGFDSNRLYAGGPSQSNT